MIKTSVAHHFIWFWSRGIRILMLEYCQFKLDEYYTVYFVILRILRTFVQYTGDFGYKLFTIAYILDSTITYLPIFKNCKDETIFQLKPFQ